MAQILMAREEGWGLRQDGGRGNETPGASQVSLGLSTVTTGV